MILDLVASVSRGVFSLYMLPRFFLLFLDSDPATRIARAPLFPPCNKMPTDTPFAKARWTLPLATRIKQPPPPPPPPPQQVAKRKVSVAFRCS